VARIVRGVVLSIVLPAVFGKTDMKRWRLPITLVVLLIIGSVAVRHTLEKRAQRRREAHYQSILREYSDSLKPGMTRLEAEKYLQSQNLTVRQMCCVNSKVFSAGVWDDLVKIGKEDAPWFCSENNVYIALDFTGQRPQGHTGWDAQSTDTLSAVTVYHWLEGCL
jgi:hypothetical protein